MSKKTMKLGLTITSLLVLSAAQAGQWEGCDPVADLEPLTGPLDASEGRAFLDRRWPGKERAQKCVFDSERTKAGNPGPLLTITCDLLSRHPKTPPGYQQTPSSLWRLYWRDDGQVTTFSARYWVVDAQKGTYKAQDCTVFGAGAIGWSPQACSSTAVLHDHDLQVAVRTAGGGLIGTLAWFHAGPPPHEGGEFVLGTALGAAPNAVDGIAKGSSRIVKAGYGPDAGL